MEPTPTSLTPALEQLRLQALHPYQLYNTMKHDTFAELVRVAAKLFDVPIAIIAFVEEEEVCFGLNYGLIPELDRVNRWETLCSVAMLSEEVSVFNDLKTNPCKLINHGLVRNLNLGFYAGSTLRTPTGYPLGMLCVIDHQARPFTLTQSNVLKRLRDIVMQLLDVRLRLLQHPTWQRELWTNIYTKIESSITRLETLASLASWETEPDSPQALVYQLSTHDEIIRVLDVLAEHIKHAAPHTA